LYRSVVEMKTNTDWEDHDSGESSYPGRPPLSMWLAKVTSSLHTSNCHFRKPSTPHSTFPVWIPILMSTLKPVASRTNLHATKFNLKILFISHFYENILCYSCILVALSFKFEDCLMNLGCFINLMFKIRKNIKDIFIIATKY